MRPCTRSLCTPPPTRPIHFPFPHQKPRQLLPGALSERPTFRRSAVATTFTTSGTELFSPDFPTKRQRKHDQRDKAARKKACALSNAVVTAERDRLSLSGQLATANVELRAARREITDNAARILALEVDLRDAKAAHATDAHRLREKLGLSQQELSFVRSSLTRRIDLDRAGDQAQGRQHARFIDTIQREHECFVASLRRSHDELTTNLRSERDEALENLARVRLERDASRRSYLHYKTIVRRSTEHRRRLADEAVRRRDEAGRRREAFPGTPPLDSDCQSVSSGAE